MKQLLAALLAGALALGLAACASRTPPAPEDPAPESLEAALPQEEESGPWEDEEESQPQESEEEDAGEAEDAAREFLTALQSGTPDRIREYADYKNLLQLEAGDSEADMLAILKRMQFELHQGERSGKAATVPATIRSVDMHQVLPDFLKQAMDLEYHNNTSDSPKPDEEMAGEYQRLFADLLDQQLGNLRERTVDLHLVQASGRWQVQATPELRAAVFGDYWEASRSVGPNAGGGQR